MRDTDLSPSKVKWTMTVKKWNAMRDAALCVSLFLYAKVGQDLAAGVHVLPIQIGGHFARSYQRVEGRTFVFIFPKDKLLPEVSDDNENPPG